MLITLMYMKSYKTKLPITSLLQQYLPIDYTDAFAFQVDTEKRLFADDIMIDIWTVVPEWVSALFRLRNILVRSLGLENGKNGANLFDEVKKIIQTGGINDMVSVVGKTENETAILLSDKHLDAYMSVFVDKQTITASTLVRYHNNLGRVYFFFIRPFHAIVVKAMLKSTLERMTKFKIREVSNADMGALKELYKNTILIINRKDYTLAEIEDWVSCGDDIPHWEQLIKEQHYILAENNDKVVVGFGSVNELGYIHTLFVHKDFQRQGIASLLYAHLENFAIEKKAERLTSEVSITAKPFFERQGFQVDEEQKRKANKLCLTNYKMSKYLTR